MSKVCMIDFHQTVIAACAVQMKDVKDSGEDLKPLVKHVALTMILNIKKKFNGKVIIACDSNKGYWRKDEYPYYKGNRKHEDDEFLNWTLIYETLNELKIELKENFPYIVLDVEGAEADDVIATMCKYHQDNELVFTGLIEEPVEIVIVSNDKDFQQLQKYQNVSQWNNIEKKFIECKNPIKFLEEHIALGDNTDNLPSITTGDEWSKARAEGNPIRAKNFKQARLNDFYNKGIDACLDDNERRNWKRNQKLIDMECIPFHINTKIISTYLDYEVKGSKTKMYNYFIKHKMKILLGSIQDF